QYFFDKNRNRIDCLPTKINCSDLIAFIDRSGYDLKRAGIRLFPALIRQSGKNKIATIIAVSDTAKDGNDINYYLLDKDSYPPGTFPTGSPLLRSAALNYIQNYISTVFFYDPKKKQRPGLNDTFNISRFYGLRYINTLMSHFGNPKTDTTWLLI